MASYRQMAPQGARWLHGMLVWVYAVVLLLGATACIVPATPTLPPATGAATGAATAIATVTVTATATVAVTAPTTTTAKATAFATATTVPTSAVFTPPPLPSSKSKTAIALLHVHWPETRVPILPPQPIEIELLAPPDIEIKANVLSSVLDPAGERYGLFALHPSDDDSASEGRNPRRYVSEKPLQLPLQPMDGAWRLVIAVQANVKVTGDQVRSFEPAPLSFCVLTDTLHAGVNLSIPRTFEVTVARGSPWAGGRAWQYQGGEVALWWAPGPLEPLLLSNALVMLETTYKPGPAPEILDAEAAQWPNSNPDSAPSAFLFHEIWPGPEGGPAEAYVIQGPDHWLYVLRMRAVGQDTIPPLIRQVGQTLTFSDF